MTELFPMNDPEYARVYSEEASMVDASELIAEAMESAGVNQAELARRLRIGRSEMNARLSGDRNITVRKLASTLHAVGWRLEISGRPKSVGPDFRSEIRKYVSVGKAHIDVDASARAMLERL